MGDTNMDKDGDLVDYNEVDPITGTVHNAPKTMTGLSTMNRKNSIKLKTMF